MTNGTFGLLRSRSICSNRCWRKAEPDSDCSMADDGGNGPEKSGRPCLGPRWQQRAGRILVAGAGDGIRGAVVVFVHRLRCRRMPLEIGVQVRLNDEAGAAGLVFHADGQDKHYGFYPSAGKLRLSCFEGPTVYQWRVLHDVPSALTLSAGGLESFEGEDREGSAAVLCQRSVGD